MKTIPVGGRVKYKSLASEKVYYGTVVTINDKVAKIMQDGEERIISIRRLQYIPNVFAGAYK